MAVFRLRAIKLTPISVPPSMVAVVPPSGTLAVGTMDVEENVKVERPNVWAEKLQYPEVSDKDNPGPEICATPSPDSSRPVGDA